MVSSRLFPCREGGKKGRKSALLSPLLCCMDVEASEAGAALQWAGIPSMDMDRPPGTSMVARSQDFLGFFPLDQWLDFAENGSLCEPGGAWHSRQGRAEPREVGLAVEVFFSSL